MTSTGWMFWIDRGGTFTDIVARAPDGRLLTHKLLSHYVAGTDAATAGISQILRTTADTALSDAEIRLVRVGTTVATNALLERTGTPTVLVTTAGFADAARIAYQNRPEIFARHIALPGQLYGHVIEAQERLDAAGNVLRPLNTAALAVQLDAAYDAGYRAVAIALLHSYREPVHERQAAGLAAQAGFTQVSVSHESSGLMKLVPRLDTTVADAYLSPGLRDYVDSLTARLPAARVEFMRSSGGVTTAAHFDGKDAILSGPAGGIVGMARTAQHAGFSHVIGFDMGGTSTDVSRFDGEFERSMETTVAGVRLRVPMLRIHTVAAGGGSVLHYDGARYRVGPDSAGADPGPVAYRRGGPLTVTDANLLLGRISPAHFPAVFGENHDERLDAAAVGAAFAALAERIADGRDAAEVALGFRRIAVSNMADAIKKISIQQGHDLADYALAAFGGAGGQHACAVADALGIDAVLLHPHAGVLSAYGMGLADISAHRETAIEQRLEAAVLPMLREQAAQLSAAAAAELAEQGIAEADMRCEVRVYVKYQGTDTALPVALNESGTMAAEFAAQYRRRFSFLLPDRPLLAEAVTVEVVASGTHPDPPRLPEASDAPVRADTIEMYCRQWESVPLYRRDRLDAGHRVVGPALITETGATTVIEPEWDATVLPHGELLCRRVSAVADTETIATAVDPVMLELFGNLFMSIAEQMGHRLRATASSVNIKERVDFSCALFDQEGELIANAPHIPVHLGSMGASVQAVIAAHGDQLREEDSYVLNNPYAGGTHLPDITVISPVFHNGQLVCYVACRGHHADIGGITPGSMPAFSTDIAEEGVLLDNWLLAGSGRLRETEIRQRLAAAAYPARNPDDNLADLRAQLAANEKGAREIRQLIDHFGRDVVHAYMGHVKDNAAEAVRRVIDELHDGAHRYLTDDGSRIEVAIRVDRTAREAHIDFTGTSPQRPGNFNAPSAVAKAAVLYVFRTLVDQEIPLNAGCLLPLRITIPDGCMLSPRYPAAVVAGNVETSQAIVGALYAALGAQAEGSGTMNNLSFGDDTHQYYETVASGSGAGPGFDGTDVVQTHMTNSRLTDPEVLEWRFPVRLESFAIRRGSGGAGQWRGGDGAERKLRFLTDMTVTLLTSHRAVAPYGMDNGEAGELGDQHIAHPDGSVTELRGRDSVAVTAGDILVLRTPGGGGYGPASARDESARHDDG